MKHNLLSLLQGVDVTEAFKTKGDLKRWSAKRTIGGLLAMTACSDIVANGMSWEAVVLAFISILPICMSFLEKENRNPDW